jgi:hypothetical protein
MVETISSCRRVRWRRCRTGTGYLTSALADRPHLLDEVTELVGDPGCLPSAAATEPG